MGLMACKTDCNLMPLLNPEPIYSDTIAYIALMSSIMNQAAALQCPYTLSAILDFASDQPFTGEPILDNLSKQNFQNMCGVKHFSN